MEAVELRSFVRRAGESAGVGQEHLDLFVDAIVEADLRGVTSHGAALLPVYVRAMQRGIINPAPELAEVQRRGAIALLDGDNGLGLVVGQLAMRAAVEAAQEMGVGIVSVRNSNHAGMLAIHVLHAARQGMIGYFTSNGPAIMPPSGGKEPRLGNGPFAFAVPTGEEPPIVLDMACSAAARGKIRLYAARDEELPAGWALDAEGRPTRDASVALEGVVLPMAGYKGYGLAFINEILAAVISGATLAAEMPRAFLSEGSTVLERWACGHFCMAIDIAATTDHDTFEDRVGRLIGLMKSSARLGADPILVPGDPEVLERERRLSTGVPINPQIIGRLHELADEIGIQRITALGSD